jgi:hypothetical protein
MRSLFLIVAAIALAAMTTAADAASKAKKAAAQPVNQDAAIAGYYDNTGRFVRDALPVFLPSWSMPLYMGTAADSSTHGKAKKAKKQ